MSTSIKSSISSTGPILTPNLARFAFRQQIENEHMRARIYDRLRNRYGIETATPEMLKSMAEDNKDAYGLALCGFAQWLVHSHVALVEAQMVLK